MESPPPKPLPPRYNASKMNIVNAISGWESERYATECSNGFIPNKTWTEKVQQMCQAIGYELGVNRPRDGGEPGKYNACHAEKQIITYWLFNYILSTPSSNQCVTWKRYDEPIRPEYYKDLHIVVSSPLCDCCDRFLNHVAAYYSISFTIHCPDKISTFPTSN
ncbi:hypothetical protein EAE96_009596 [Botrytis aclada]|nr:hypothetical protein EAE96_009596 [Botrytis aclada]